MSVEVLDRVFAEPLAERLRATGNRGDVVLHWLGQAGFVISTGGYRVLIDPYLSNSLAEKYRGTGTPHERMMAAPIDVRELGPVDLVLVTHHHTDHMDPATLRPLGEANPALKFVVPRASRAEASRRAWVTESRLVPMDAGETVSPLPNVAITAIRAAHETLERDAEGCHRFLGYALTVGATTVVHTGDTVPYPGQVEEVARLRPDLLMLPVNGRLPERGVPGNLTLDEAIRLTIETGTPSMIAHHHGMFAFNTLPLACIEARAAEPGLPIRVVPARAGLEVRLRAA